MYVCTLSHKVVVLGFHVNENSFEKVQNQKCFCVLSTVIFVMPIQTVGHELVLYPESIGRHAVVSLEDDSDPVSLGSERLWYRRAALFTDRGRADHTTVQYVYVIKVTPGVVLQRKVLKGHLEYKHITFF